MAGPKIRVMIDLLEEHFDEVAILWEQRHSAIHSPDHMPRNLADLNERIEAHVDGLLVADQAALPLLARGLASDEPAVVFAAAYVLLRRHDQPSADQLMDAFLQAQAGQLEAIRQALCQGPLDLVGTRLKTAYEQGPAAVASAAAEVFAFHGQVRRQVSRLPEFFGHEDPAVRQTAWRIAALTDHAEGQQLAAGAGP